MTVHSFECPLQLGRTCPKICSRSLAWSEKDWGKVFFKTKILHLNLILATCSIFQSVNLEKLKQLTVLDVPLHVEVEVWSRQGSWGLVRLDSIAISLFGNMTVEPREIHIITKEWDGCRDPSGKGCKTFEGPQISDKWTKLPFLDRLALLCM